MGTVHAAITADAERRNDERLAHARLETAFDCRDEPHFAWQTEHPVVAPAERALVRAAFAPLGERVLDVGCGEGATFIHLDAPAGSVGLDLFDSKLELARSRRPDCEFIVGSATALPFPADRFDHVIARDLVHHLREPEAFVAEVARVLVQGGRFDLLEPCGLNPLVAAHAIARPVERGELRSTASRLRRLVGSQLRVVAVDRHQPLPLHRIVYHPELGRPALSGNRWVTTAVAAIERAAGWVLPRTMWAYIHLRALRAG